MRSTAARDRAAGRVVRARLRPGARRAELLGRLRLPRRAAAPASSRSATPTTTIPAADIAAPGRDAALRALRRHRPGRLAASRTATAASASRSRPPTAWSGRTATSPTSSRRSSPAPSWPPASRSASSARPATRPGRTCTSSSQPATAYPAGRAVVPELRGLGLLLVGRLPDERGAPARSSRSSTSRGPGSSRTLDSAAGPVVLFTTSGA